MRLPARRPPACFSVRPGNTMTMFSPSCLSRSRWPILKPSPMATISTIEATPQAIPAMVRKLRSLFRSRLEMTWPNNSCRYVTGVVLLQDDLLALGQALQDLGLGSVADARGYRHAPLSALGGGVRHLYFRRAILLINDGALGNRQHPLVLLEHDLGVGRHGGHELPGFVGYGNAHFESSDVVLLHSHGRDLGYFAPEFPVLVRFHRDAGRLPQVDHSDIALVHLALDVHLPQVAQRHDQGGPRAHGQDRAYGVAHFAVPRKHY